ncbi:MAG: hypothetical protein KC549_02820 [Myxococcales bacterium]|nr:hypothetical protein [Myxococcales bacterium]MCB9545752.1 hypothetical protein [Myxococcales bacterium]
MRRALLPLLFLACSDAPPEPGQAVTHDTASARQVDALLVEITLEATDGRAIAPEHIVEVTLDVDDERWGRFELAAPLPEAADEAGDWRLLDAPRGALLVARLTADADAADAPPATVGAWLDLLDRRLAPGAHAARLSEVVLEDAAGVRRTLRADGWLPFDAPLGAGSAWIGALTLTVELDR